MMRRVTTRLALVLGGLVVALLLAEGVLRLFAPGSVYSYPGQLYREHPTRYYEMVPGFHGTMSQADYSFEFRLNELGYRERGLDALPEGPRVWLLGDSLVFGQGVDAERVMSVQLETALANDGGPATVVNGGVGGYGTVNTVAQLRDHVDAVAPDLVIVTLNLSNDIEDNLLAPEMIVRGGYLGRARAGGTAPSAADVWLRAHLRSYQVVRRVLEGARGPVEVHQEDQIFQVPMPPPDEAPHFVELARGGPVNERIQSMLDATDHALGELAAEATTRGLPIGVVIMPGSFNFRPAELQQVARHARVPDGQVDSTRIVDRARALVEGHGLPMLDLCPIFSAAPDPGALTFRYDTHYSAEGHRLAAESMAPWVGQLLARHD
ncbi:MAG: hypothetical protein CMJ87_13150 [Planctomycetes bacterium]|jgi:hypothetical protein|nr:hypothetical protein [Planctomycetota bacterium]